MCCTAGSSKTRMLSFVSFWEIWWDVKWQQCPGTSVLNIFAEHEVALPDGQVIELGTEHFRKTLLLLTAWFCSFSRFYFRNCSLETSENTSGIKNVVLKFLFHLYMRIDYENNTFFKISKHIKKQQVFQNWQPTCTFYRSAQK